MVVDGLKFPLKFLGALAGLRIKSAVSNLCGEKADQVPQMLPCKASGCGDGLGTVFVRGGVLVPRLAFHNLRILNGSLGTRGSAYGNRTRLCFAIFQAFGDFGHGWGRFGDDFLSSPRCVNMLFNWRSVYAVTMPPGRMRSGPRGWILRPFGMRWTRGLPLLPDSSSAARWIL